MGSIQRQESFCDDEDSYVTDDVILEAPTLSSKEMARAREEALYVLRTKSPEEAFRIFTEGLKYKIDSTPVGAGQDQAQAQAQTARPPTPPAAGNGKGQSQATVPPPRN